MTRLLGHNRAFWLCVVTWSSVSQHGPHVAGGFRVAIGFGVATQFGQGGESLS